MYLDPGFGSMLIQALIAGFAAVVVLIGIYRAKIKAFFSRKRKGSDEDDSDGIGDEASESAENAAEENKEEINTEEDSPDG